MLRICIILAGILFIVNDIMIIIFFQNRVFAAFANPLITEVQHRSFTATIILMGLALIFLIILYKRSFTNANNKWATTICIVALTLWTQFLSAQYICYGYVNYQNPEGKHCSEWRIREYYSFFPIRWLNVEDCSDCDVKEIRVFEDYMAKYGFSDKNEIDGVLTRQYTWQNGKKKWTVINGLGPFFTLSCTESQL